DPTGDEDPIDEDEDEDTRVGDLEVSVSLGEILSGGRKSQESNIDGLIAGEKTSMSKRYLVKSFEESRELFSNVAGK
ncbi:hypothetical protein Tco_1188886, partial [Tanacetum coccineum]